MKPSIKSINDQCLIAIKEKQQDKGNAGKKYELTDETIRAGGTHPGGPKLYRIRALRDFLNVKAGDLGGFIESEDNLSHKGNCWVYKDAFVFGNAQVYGNALVFGKAKVYDNAQVYDVAQVYGAAQVYGEAEVYGNARVFDHAHVYDKAKAYGNVQLGADTDLNGTSRIR